MKDYDTKYEEYKESLLKTWYFTNKFKELYEGTISAEKDYIDQNGVLWKVGILSAACGFCFAFHSVLEGRTDTSSIIIRIVIAVIGIVCFFLAMHLGAKYKKRSGEAAFYAFQYDRYIKDYIANEKQRETDKLMRDVLEKYDNILWRAELLAENSDDNTEQLEANLLYIIKSNNTFQERYETISMYDRFAKDLQDDYYFSKAIHELLHKGESS